MQAHKACPEALQVAHLRLLIAFKVLHKQTRPKINDPEKIKISKNVL
jgi:hypothetical protein